MTKKIKETETVEEIENALSKTEQYIERNQKNLTIILVVILAVVAIIWAYKRYNHNQNQEALSRMFMAEQYFARDSFNLALKGDGNAAGFIEVVNNYGGTKAGNLANYYAGISFLNLGNYDEAISYLEDFDSDDLVVSATGKCALGDAYMQKGDTEKALKNYLKASSDNENNFTTPLFLLKVGFAYEVLGKYDEALKVYEDIKLNFKNSQESRKAEKLITRAKLKMTNS